MQEASNVAFNVCFSILFCRYLQFLHIMKCSLRSWERGFNTGMSNRRLEMSFWMWWVRFLLVLIHLTMLCQLSYVISIKYEVEGLVMIGGSLWSDCSFCIMYWSNIFTAGKKQSDSLFIIKQCTDKCTDRRMIQSSLVYWGHSRCGRNFPLVSILSQFALVRVLPVQSLHEINIAYF